MNKEAFLRKLMADNLVELRSIKECKAKGFLPKNVEDNMIDPAEHLT